MDGLSNYSHRSTVGAVWTEKHKTNLTVKNVQVLAEQHSSSMGHSEKYQSHATVLSCMLASLHPLDSIKLCSG